MELTSNVVIVIAVVAVAVGFLLIRGRRHEAPAPADSPVAHARGGTMTGRDERGSQALVDWLLERASEQTGFSVADDALARDRIVQAAGKAMEEVRTNGSASVSLPFLVADARGPKHFDVRFKRNADSTFELLH